MTAAPTLSWQLAVALLALLTFDLAASRAGHVGIQREVTVAAIRAVIQLGLVAVAIGAVLERRWAALLFVVVMFSVATATVAGRIQARRCVPWVALAIAGGIGPVLTIIIALQAAAFTGPAIIAISGIIIGGAMTAHTLTARRAFDTMRTDRGQVEAGLALGLNRQASISLVIGRHAREAVIPAIDQTRTVGLVTLPGAFIGVLLGGGTAAEAAASQILVLVGLLAAETSVVVLTQRLIAEGRILPHDVVDALPARSRQPTASGSVASLATVELAGRSRWAIG